MASSSSRVVEYYTLNVPMRLVYAQPPKLRDALLWEINRYARWEWFLNDPWPGWGPHWRQNARRNMDDAAAKVEALLQLISTIRPDEALTGDTP